METLGTKIPVRSRVGKTVLSLFETLVDLKLQGTGGSKAKDSEKQRNIFQQSQGSDAEKFRTHQIEGSWWMQQSQE